MDLPANHTFLLQVNQFIRAEEKRRHGVTVTVLGLLSTRLLLTTSLDQLLPMLGLVQLQILFYHFMENFFLWTKAQFQFLQKCHHQLHQLLHHLLLSLLVLQQHPQLNQLEHQQENLI